MLKRKAIEIFDDFNKVMEAENLTFEKAKSAGKDYTPHYKQIIKFGLLEITLHSINDINYDTCTCERVLEVYIFNTEYRQNRSFPHSEDGFIAACEWIDEQREKIIEEIS